MLCVTLKSRVSRLLLRVDRLRTDLHLKTEQADKLRPVLIQMDDELSNLHSLDLPETDGIFSRAKARMDPIITPEQRQQLQQILDEHRRHFEEALHDAER
jgi:hypothetical protein